MGASQRLTTRQLEAARLYAAGHPSKEIARKLKLAPATVRNHLAMGYEVFGVHDKLALARRIQHAPT